MNSTYWLTRPVCPFFRIETHCSHKNCEPIWSYVLTEVSVQRGSNSYLLHGWLILVQLIFLRYNILFPPYLILSKYLSIPVEIPIICDKCAKQNKTACHFLVLYHMIFYMFWSIIGAGGSIRTLILQNLRPLKPHWKLIHLQNGRSGLQSCLGKTLMNHCLATVQSQIKHGLWPLGHMALIQT